ncbi:MAG: hypothetical protein AAGA77_26200 [Bacteroidota bacterium]
MSKNLIWGLLTIALLITACGDDDPDNTTPDVIAYGNGTIVVNQGIFNSGTGSLDFRDRNSGEVSQNIYADANDGAVLGNVVQSVIEHKGNSYIAVNNGGKIVVANEETFTYIDTIGGIDQSRYFASSGDKLYVTSWGNTGTNGGIYEINSSSNSIADFIDTGNGPEGILFADDLLYVAKGGGFGRDSLVLIIDPSDNSIVESLVVGDNPQLMVKDDQDDVYVICRGFTDFVDPTNNTNGKIVKISNQEIEWSYEVPNGSSNLTIDRDNEFLYFVSLGSVVKQDMNATTFNPTTIRTLFAYALGFDHEDDVLYIADAKDFSSAGTAYMYSTNDVAIDSFTTGIIPGYFYFKG